MKKVGVFKMVTGEEVVAYFSVINDQYEIDRPRVIQLIPQQSGQMGMGMIPWFLSDPDAVVKIGHGQFIGPIDAPKQLEDIYMQQVSGIELATGV